MAHRQGARRHRGLTRPQHERDLGLGRGRPGHRMGHPCHPRPRIEPSGPNALRTTGPSHDPRIFAHLRLDAGLGEQQRPRRSRVAILEGRWRFLNLRGAGADGGCRGSLIKRALLQNPLHFQGCFSVDHRDSRVGAGMPPPSSNRTCGFPASGFPVGLVVAK
jgi:hypothetical protein